MNAYYKFYKADNLHVEDVFKESRIYMTDYQGMWNSNDDSEGRYWLDPSISKSLREKVKKEKKNFMIGCVTNMMRNADMWQEFADGGNGICIKVRPKIEENVRFFKVIYLDSRPHIAPWQINNMSPELIAVEILKHKLAIFSNENETRILKRVSDGRTFDFLPVIIDKLYIGWNVSEEKERKFISYAAKAGVKVIKLHKPIS